MSELVKVAIAEASREALLYYCRTVLNIEVSNSANNGALIAKILKAEPTSTEIKVPAELAQPAETAKAESAPVAEKPAAKASRIPAGTAGTHWRYDPKVTVEIMTTTDGTRPKDVQLSCQGEVIIMKRGKKVEIPYRHFLVLRDAVERVARDADEINPETGLPFKEWVEQNSYPYQVHAMPSPDEIAAWEERTSAVELA